MSPFSRQLIAGGLGLWLLAAATGRATDTVGDLPYAPRHYVCYRTETPLIIDGRPGDPAWSQVPWTADFADIEGPSRSAPRFRTRVKMLWDDDYFYVYAEMEEPHLWATVTERDAVIFRDHDFEVFIDPDDDTHRYFEFEMNALNTVWDLCLARPYRDRPGVLNAWDIKRLRSAVHLNGTLNDPADVDRGWSVEIAFPWKVLQEGYFKRRPPAPGEHYRVNFSRVEWRTEAGDGAYRKVTNPATGKPFPEDNWVWSPQGHVNMHMPERWGFVQFSGLPAGAGPETFVPPPEDVAKWALRQLYYRQRAHHRETGRYASDVRELGLEDLEVPGFGWPAEIQATWNLYEARLPSVDGDAVWHIKQDGKVWNAQTDRKP